MAGAKITVMYPWPSDMEAFEKPYGEEHLPMAAPIFQAAGANKVVLSRSTGSPSGTPQFHRIAEIRFPSMSELNACAASKAGQETIAHAHKISNGGAQVVLIAEEEVVTF